MPLGRHTLPVQSAGQYPVWHPNWPFHQSLWAQHGQLTVNFLSLWTSTPHHLASLFIFGREHVPHVAIPTQASLCHFVQIGFFQWGKNLHKLPSSSSGPASHTVTYPSSLQTQTSELTGWWCVTPHGSLGQACSTWLPMGFWTKCLPQQQPDFKSHTTLQFQILVASALSESRH